MTSLDLAQAEHEINGRDFYDHTARELLDEVRRLRSEVAAQAAETFLRGLSIERRINWLDERFCLDCGREMAGDAGCWCRAHG